MIRDGQKFASVGIKRREFHTEKSWSIRHCSVGLVPLHLEACCNLQALPLLGAMEGLTPSFDDAFLGILQVSPLFLASFSRHRARTLQLYRMRFLPSCETSLVAEIWISTLTVSSYVPSTSSSFFLSLSPTNILILACSTSR